MALRTAPGPIAPQRANLAVLRGPGMTPAALRDEAAIEQRVHDEEVAAFCEAARPHARTLEWATRELTPSAHQHALALLALIDRLGRQWGGEAA